MSDTPTPRQAPPVQTPEAREAALAKGLAVRRAQADFKEELKAGKHGTDALKVLAHAGADEKLQRMYVRAFLEAWPGVGKVGSKRIMDELHIADNRRIQGLGRQQREGLAWRLRANPTPIKAENA